MIARLRGRIAGRAGTGLIVDVNGVGYLVAATPSVLRKAAPGDELTAEPADHPAIRISGGASAWQIATASASAAWFGVGISSRPRIAFTIFPTCSFSARP